MENFHAKYGAGALVATPLLSSSSRRVKGLKGLHEHKSFGALLVDLDLQPGTPIDLRCSTTVILNIIFTAASLPSGVVC